jgi:Flp pilus assembly protein TadG
MIGSLAIRLWKGRDAAVGAEFAMLLPLTLILLLGTFDVGRYMYELNKVEKATQMGARMAVVTDMVPGGLAATNFGTSLGQGAAIPTSSFGAATCSKPAGTVTCNCSTTPCPTLTPVNSAAFDAVVTRMRLIDGTISAANVNIIYTNSGLGYAGDPNGPDVAPIVRVEVTHASFAPLVFSMFGATLPFPTQSASLTLEDGTGSTSN